MNDQPADIAAVLGEQIEYYRARAPEYDEWFERRGMYDLGEELNREWLDEASKLDAAVAAFRPAGEVLEFACGTGWWTVHLAASADRVIAVDTAPEAIAINRDRLGGAPHVEYVCADAFGWEPPTQFDVVFFSFWLSHVPDDRFEEFWRLVDRCLRPGGRVLFLDNFRGPASPTLDRARAMIQPEEHGDGTVVRRLNDGRLFRIVKIYWTPEELEARLAGLGWDVRVATTGRFFLIGQVTRPD